MGRLLWRLIACNPFYPISAAFLLYGVYRVSGDADFLGEELTQLTFNFGTLQFYEWLVMLTAVFLARHWLWYDSLLLVTLENMLVLVPFMFLSQASLIGDEALGNGIMWTMCAVAAVQVLGRFGGFKSWLPEAHLPGRVLGVGAVILAVNTALPIFYRVFHETKVGTGTTEGSAYATFQFSWLALLPVLVALAWFVPLGRNGKDAGARRHWMSPGYFALWLTGTGMHLWCLAYVYDFDIRPHHFAMPAWVAGWLLVARLGELWPARPARAAKVTLALPALAILFALNGDGMFLFRALAAANAAAFCVLTLRRYERETSLQWLTVSLAALVATLPLDWAVHAAASASVGRADLLGMATGGCILFWVVRSRKPRLAIPGALVAGCAVDRFVGGGAEALPLAIQSSLIFLVLHSLRWNARHSLIAVAARGLSMVAWVAHAWWWVMKSGAEAGWMTGGLAFAALSIYGIHRLCGGARQPWLLPAATSILLSGPASYTGHGLMSAPVGVAALLGSLVLFAAGTTLALTRPRWVQGSQRSEVRGQRTED